MKGLNKLAIGREVLELNIRDEKPYIIYQDNEYYSVNALMKACPELTDEEKLNTLIKVVIHLFFGDLFGLIEYPADYVERFWNRIVSERISPWPEGETVIKRQINFAVAKITSPMLLEDIVTCYLEDTTQNPFVFYFNFEDPESYFDIEPLLE